jgi:hypothetical protein
MRVIFSVHEDTGAVNWIETDPTLYHQVRHPDNVTGHVGVDVMLAHHNENPDAREIGGWHTMTQLPGEDKPMRMWDRLVAACNSEEATEQAKALKLK